MRKCFIFALILYASILWADAKRGQYYFRQYCLGCHSLAYANPSEETHLEKLDAIKWFKVEPPDLSLIGMQHSRAWIVAYLKGFYRDDKRPFGVNNHLSPDILMPNVLESPLVLDHNNAKIETDLLVQDIADFLTQTGAPEHQDRHFYGKLVLCFCLIMLGFSLILRRMYRL